MFQVCDVTLTSLTNCEILVIAGLGLWLFLSAICQIRIDEIQRIRKLDLLHLVPQYNFFAPTPGTCDFHLLYRDQLGDGVLTDWTEVSDIAPRRWWNIIWHPKRRRKKAVFDLVTTLTKESQHYGRVYVQISVPYLIALNYVSHLTHHPASVATQFLLMLSRGTLATGEPDLVFLSNLHNLDREESKGGSESLYR